MIKKTFLMPFIPVAMVLYADAIDISALDYAQQEVRTVSSFQEAVLLAYMHNVEWKQAVTSVHKAHADKWLHHLRLWLPDITAEMHNVVCPTIITDMYREKRDIYDKKSDSDKKSYKWKNIAVSMQYNVHASWVLFNGFASINSYKAANAQERGALYHMQLAEQKMIMQVLEAYCNVWYQRECLKAARQKQSNLQIELDANKHKLAAGTGTQADVSQAKSNYEKAVYEYREARTQLASAEAEFTRVVGGKLSQKIKLPKCDFKLPKTLASLIKTSMVAHPSVYQAEYARMSAEYVRRSTKGASWPQVDGRVSWGALPGFKKNGEDYNRGFSIGVNVKWTPIAGQSGFVYCNQAKAASDVEQQVVAKANVHQNLLKECKTAWVNAQSAESMICASQASVKSAEDSRKNNEAQRIYGLRSTTENLINENQLLESRQALAKSKVQRVISHYKMISLIGALNGYYIMKTDPKALRKVLGDDDAKFEEMIGAPTELHDTQREIVANVQVQSEQDKQIVNVLHYPDYILSPDAAKDQDSDIQDPRNVEKKASPENKEMHVVIKPQVTSAPSA